MVIKLAGSVLDVFQIQGHTQNEVYEHGRNRGSKINEGVILVDLPRTAIVDFTGHTFTDFINECKSEEVYNEQYAQGNLDGGEAITAYILHYIRKSTELFNEAETLPANSQEKIRKEREAELFLQDWSIAQRDLRFAYRDYNGDLCSLGFVFNIDRTDNWVLQITRNTIAPIELRTTTLFAQGEIVSSARGTIIDAPSMPEEIASALGHTEVARLVYNLIDENGNVSLEKFDDLDRRIKVNRNLVDFEARQKKLAEELTRLKVELPNKPRVTEALRKIRINSLDNPDFFNDDKFIHTLKIIGNIEEYEKRLFDFQEALTKFQKPRMTTKEIKLHAEGYQLLQMIQNIAGNDLSLLNNNNLNDLNRILEHSTTALCNPKDKPNMVELVKLSQSISGQQSPLWQSLGKVLLSYAALALVFAGVIAAIPSAGSSFLLVAGALGITASISGAAGFGIFSQNRKDRLAKSVSDFKSAIDDMPTSKPTT